VDLCGSETGKPSEKPGRFKDFVEHIRTIHFALVTVSTGLIILTLSSKPYNPKIASEEITQILNLQKVGSPNFLNQKYDQKAELKPAQSIPPSFSHSHYYPEMAIGFDPERMSHP
jgi:hypothetical protein